MKLTTKQKEELLEKLAFEAGTAEDLIMAYAYKHKYKDFLEKWGEKPYSDEDHTITNMLYDLFAKIDGEPF